MSQSNDPTLTSGCQPYRGAAILGTPQRLMREPTMLAKIIGFEIRYQLRSALFAIGFVIFFLLTFAATTSSSVQIGSSANLLVNAPYALLERVGIMSLLGMFVFTAFMANVVIRDDETGLAPIIRTTRMSKFDYLFGRFLGAYVVAFLVMASVPLAILIGSLMPWLDPERVGPLVVGHYLEALFVYMAPTVLIAGAMFFALATATRSMMWTYLGVIGWLVLWLVAQTLLDNLDLDTASALADPFGLSALELTTRYWTAAERNTQTPQITGVLLYNRLLWMAIAAAVLAIAYAVFRFEARGRRVAAAAAEPQEQATPPLVVKPVAPPRRAASSWQQLAALTRFDVGFVLKSPAFFVLLGLGVFLTVGNLQPTVEQRSVEFLPVTRAMVDTLFGSFTLFPLIIAIYYAGELAWRDRERRIHEIIDASAAPNWTFVIPKVIAIAVVLLASLLVAVATAVLFQLYHGYTRIELAAYLLWFVLPILIAMTLLAVLAVFVQAVVPHKFFGWAVMVVYLVASQTLSSSGFEHHLYDYGSGPEVPLSDMNGMGRFWVGRAWLQAYWSAFAVLLLVGAHVLWRRGTDTSLRPRLAAAPRRLRGTAGWTLAAAAVAWVGLGAFIFYNTNVLNQYRSTQDVERLTAEYEKALLKYETLPQPRVVDVKLNVALYPRQVRADTEGVYTIENRTVAALESVHVGWDRQLQMRELVVEGAHPGQEYPQFNYRIYQFDTPLQPGERRQIRFTTVLEERGFKNHDPLTRIVANGTFLDNTNIAPVLGVNRATLLRERYKRRKYGLPAELRPAKLEDQSASAYQPIRRDSDWVNAELTVTTDADQTPIAPGYTLSDTVQGGRRTLVTRTDAPILHFFSIQSGRYAVTKDTWTNANGAAVDLAVYSHPAHQYNVARMLVAMKTSLSLFSERFSPFQFRQARILEFPAYARFAQSFANTVPFAEGIGFTQNYHDARSDETVDQVSYVTAHEIGHQWWAHQLIGADKQGSALLTETLAQYSALLVMEKMYGREQIRKFLRTELDQYLRSRGQESVEELPLLRVEDQPYIYYQKGSLAMYWLREIVGEDVVNRALQKLLAQFAFKAAPYASSTDFIGLLRAEAGPQHDALISDLFEKIAVYDLQARDATAVRRADGKYQVSFTVAASKRYADGAGLEREAALEESFDVGAFSAEPGKRGYTSAAALLMQQQQFQSGTRRVTLLMDQAPKFVGVDPYNKRVDRNSSDNLTKVTLQAPTK